MLFRQFLLASARPNHPNHKADETHAGLQRFKDDVLPLTVNYITDGPNNRIGIRTIHCISVRNCITTNGYNEVLNDQAANINISEINILKKTRTTLSQLRSGY